MQMAAQKREYYDRQAAAAKNRAACGEEVQVRRRAAFPSPCFSLFSQRMHTFLFYYPIAWHTASVCAFAAGVPVWLLDGMRL